MRHDRVIGYLDNISSSEPTGYDTYTCTSVHHHTYGTPNGSERRVRIPYDWHAKSDRRARTTCRGGPRSPRAACHRDRTRPHDQIGPGGDLVRQRQPACRPKSGRLTTLRVRRRTRSAVLRSARSAAGATRSGAAGPRPTCPAPMPSSSANGPPAGARGQLKYPLPCRPRDGRRIGGPTMRESGARFGTWTRRSASQRHAPHTIVGRAKRSRGLIYRSRW